MFGWISVIFIVIGGVSTIPTFFMDISIGTYNTIWNFALVMGIAAAVSIAIAGFTGRD